MNILTEHLFPGNFSRFFQEFLINPTIDSIDIITAIIRVYFGTNVELKINLPFIYVKKKKIDKNSANAICETFNYIDIYKIEENNIIFKYDLLKHRKLIFKKTADFFKKNIPNSIVKIGKYSINIRYPISDKNNYFSNNLLSMHIDGVIIPLEVEDVKEINGGYSIYLSELSKQLIKLYDEKKMSLFYGDKMIGFTGINPITTGNKVKIDKFVNSVKIDFVSKGVSENSSLLIILFIIAYLIFLITILYLLFKKKISFLLGFTILFLIFGFSYTLIFSLVFSFVIGNFSIKQKIIFLLFFTTLNFYLIW